MRLGFGLLTHPTARLAIYITVRRSEERNACAAMLCSLLCCHRWGCAPLLSVF